MLHSTVNSLRRKSRSLCSTLPTRSALPRNVTASRRVDQILSDIWLRLPCGPLACRWRFNAVRKCSVASLCVCVCVCVYKGVCRGRNFRTRIAATFDLVFLRLLVNSYTHALVSFEVDAADPQVVTRAGEPWQVFQSLAIGMYCLCVCIGENNQHVGTSFQQ